MSKRLHTGQEKEEVSNKRNKASQVLSPEQLHVYGLVVNKNESVFFTGAAGTGKSHLLRILKEALEHKHGVHAVQVTATTGIAACNVEGTTIHSFASLGIDSEHETTPSKAVSRIRKDKKALERWKECKTLIIDEISMLSAFLLDRVEEIARLVRDESCAMKPFGGLQLVVCGDFLQLPPVIKNGAKCESDSSSSFAFNASCWKRSFQHSIELRTVFRQSADPTYARFLAEIRRGEVSLECEEFLRSRVKVALDGERTRLFCHNHMVEKLNLAELGKIAHERVHQFDAKDTLLVGGGAGRGNDHLTRKLDSVCLAPRRLELKKGALVMLLRNINFPMGLVNGRQGKVVGFSRNGFGYPIVLFHNGVTCTVERKMGVWEIRQGSQVVLARREQVPLMLAYAGTVHKFQGMSVDFAEVDISRAFADGQAYVALSRLRTAAGLSLAEAFDVSTIKTNKHALEFHEAISQAQKSSSEEDNDNRDKGKEQSV